MISTAVKQQPLKRNVAYRDYGKILEKQQDQKQMSYRDKKRLIQSIDRLDQKDHLGILETIINSTDRKNYTINNYGTYVDLDDLDESILWKIQNFVNLCMENQRREKVKETAGRKYKEDLDRFEEDLRNRSKLKLSVSIPADDKPATTTTTSNNTTTNNNNHHNNRHNHHHHNNTTTPNTNNNNITNNTSSSNTTTTTNTTTTPPLLLIPEDGELEVENKIGCQEPDDEEEEVFVPSPDQPCEDEEDDDDELDDEDRDDISE